MSPVPEEDHDKHDGSGEEIENFGTSEIVIPAVIDIDDVESDDENGDNGYQLLAQDPDAVNGNADNSDDSDSGMTDEDDCQNVDTATGLVPSGLYPNFPEGDLPSYLQVPELAKTDKKDVLWNQPRSASADMMDSGHIAKIKNAMQGFQLPPCNIPDWAQNVTDDKWKDQLLSRISTDNTAVSQPSLESGNSGISVHDHDNKEAETG